jgi:hypothetical protein
MRKVVLIICLSLLSIFLKAQTVPSLTADIADKLSKMPLSCIEQEFPNKTSHTSITEVDAKLLPSQLHPAFYGCFDWHSSVHGHWMLIRLLKTMPNFANRQTVIDKFNKTFTLEKMQAEADYFTKYELAKLYERTYGWAWLLKLDQELATWDNADAKRWHAALQPLTQQILKLWKAYLPKQTYPNRTGVHGNTAFGLVFALDWARNFKDKEFEQLIVKKSNEFYFNNINTPAYMEPDGADFFSPSLEIADLMRRVLPQAKFVTWLNKFYSEASLKRISEIPTISDITDYQGVHLVGLSFTRAWCMRGIANNLPANHKLKNRFKTSADKFLVNALPLVFASNYGGDHWLASFAVYALEK